jgi:predicted unusual protein kinase regulating ubiquinone biosynthesis (AarF/ABC1/UbiB family)
VTDIPRRTAARTAKLASLPLGVAGRAAAGWGRRLAGGDGDEISAQLMARSAEQLFAVLGELKGGAMKFGQALSVFEAAIPDEYAAPFRESLVKLQSAAPPMPASDVHRMLAEQFGRGWRERFREFDETPAAAASIGQVHRAVWRDGREVAVKVQYPGAGEALRSDLRQLSRMSRLMQPLVPGLEIKPLIAELRERMEEELDYRDEAENQRVFAAAYDGDSTIKVPRVVASAPRAMVSEWVSGRRLSDVIRSGTQAERGGAAAMLAEFHYSAPARVGLLHADPHPGNFQILDDGRLMVLDYGAVARLPDGLPRPLSIMVRLALENKPSELLQLLRDNGFLRAGSPLAAEEAVQYLAPFTEPLRTESFHFNRRWLQRQAERVGDLRRPEFRTGRELNLPPQYLLVHRVTMGTLGVLCQLDADVPLRGIVQHWQPWIFDANDETASRHA